MSEDGDDLRTTAASGPRTRRARSDTSPGMHRATARLVCVAGAERGTSYAIGAAPIVLGRGATADVNLAAPDISREHTRIVPDGDAITVEDLGSRNGTLVDGQAIHGPVPVRAGSRIQLGDTTIFVITQHDELESSMRQLQKLEAMEQLVGGLAHDFNNALTLIVVGLDLLANRVSTASPEVQKTIADLKGAANGASALARRLMHFRRADRELPMDTISIASLVEGTLALARHALPANIELSTAAPQAIAVRGTRDDLQQVLLNLVLNARDAMPDGGRLTIAARLIGLTRTDAAARQLDTAGDYAELIVVDSGCGMNEATIARAFEPFFTTKDPGHGTGLGLAMVHSIVRRHGGAVAVESVVGSGTTVRIWLPAA